MKEINPVVGIALAVIALVAVGFFMWRASSPPVYSGPPIDMGKMMRNAGQNGPPPTATGQSVPSQGAPQRGAPR